MSALLIIYSPHGPALSVPRDVVTVLAITCDPPRRAPRLRLVQKSIIELTYRS